MLLAKETAEKFSFDTFNPKISCGLLLTVLVPERIVVTSKLPNANRRNLLTDDPKKGAAACAAVVNISADEPAIKLRRFNKDGLLILYLFSKLLSKFLLFKV